MKPIVSIITPIYNSEKTIEETINSVLNQTFKEFELIIVDDLSTDKTVSIIKKYQELDNRIKLFVLSKKGGATGARNRAIKEAKGRYVAFLDADDLWKKDKLEKQIKFMQDNQIAFSYTDYDYIDEYSNNLNRYRKCPQKVTYFRMLLGDSIGCLTVIYDSKIVGKIKIPNITKRNDYALWCLILKKVKVGYKYKEILASYRKSNGSLSSGKKAHLLKYHYQLHQEINGFNLVIATFFTILNIVNYFFNIKFRDRSLK